MNGYEFYKGPWQNVSWLIDETEKFYQENITPKGLGDRFSVARDKIIERRKWQPSIRLIKDTLEPVLRELNIFYVPKQMDPGPGVAFPIRDIHDNMTHGKFHPFYELLMKNREGQETVAKYAALGKKESMRGPAFFGNSDECLRNIGRTQSVALVEGPYDLLGCRVLVRDCPVLSTGTKSFSIEHIYYLRMLGAKTFYLMFDNEPAKGEKTMGAGNQAMDYLAFKWSKDTGLDFRPLLCPADDASTCLEHGETAVTLTNILARVAHP